MTLGGYGLRNSHKLWKMTTASAVVVGSIVMAVSPVGAVGEIFTDITAKSSAYKEVMSLTERGIINGFNDGTYRPSQAVTRGQAAKLLVELLNLDVENVQDPKYNDVPQTNPFYKHIAALANKGIILGYEDGSFGVGDPLLRGQMAKILSESFGFEQKEYQAKTFSDVKAESYYAKYVQGLVNLKVTTGTTPTTFSPNAVVTRGQMAQFLFRSDAVKFGSYVVADIQGLKNGQVVTTEGSYDVSTSLKAFFTTDNEQALKNATLTFRVQNGQIVSLEGIELKSSGTVAGLALNAHIDTMVIDTTTPLTLTGTGTIGKLTILSKAKVTLNFIGKIGILQLSQNSNVDISNQTKIDNLQFPVGLKVEDLVGNFKTAKNNIKEINGKKNPDYNAATLPSTGGGGGGGGGGGSTPAPGGDGNGGGTPPDDKNFNLSLMHTNDTHAQLDNVAKRVTAVKEVRAKKPSALLIDAGDVFSGTLYFNEFKGQADLEFMNLMKYDMMTFGNHEFDLGSSDTGHKELADFIKGAKFPFVSSNVNFSKDDSFDGLFSDLISSDPKNGKIYSGMVRVIDGEKVGFFGLTTADTKDISSPGKVEFEDYIEEAKKAVKAFEGMGVNKIIAVTHIGYDDNPATDNDLELAARVEGIDVIVGGHSHTELKEPTVITKDKNGKSKDPTIIVQAYQYNEFLGTLDVEFDKNGKVIGQAGQLIKIADKKADPEAEKLLEKYSSKIAEVKNKPTGATAVNALDNPRGSDTSVRKNETPLGNLITDGMLAKAKTYNENVIMALQNGGGIRAGIDQGPITVGEVITVLPFGNTLAIMELSGAELKAGFEISFRDYPKENGGFLHVSGAQVKFDSSQPVGKRVISIAYKNADGTYTEIQDAKKYTIATNAFTAKGGDGFTVFKKAYEEGRVTDLGLSDWENLRDHVAKLVTVDPKMEGRIVDVAGEEPGGPQVVDPKDFSGTIGAPKTYNGDVLVTIADTTKLEHAIVKGNLVLIGTVAKEISFINIQVEGKLDISGLKSPRMNFNGITVKGETTF